MVGSGGDLSDWAEISLLLQEELVPRRCRETSRVLWVHRALATLSLVVLKPLRDAAPAPKDTTLFERQRMIQATADLLDALLLERHLQLSVLNELREPLSHSILDDCEALTIVLRY